MLARTHEYNFRDVKQSIENFEAALISNDHDKEFDLVGHLKGLIDEYKSKESRFEILDSHNKS